MMATEVMAVLDGGLLDQGHTTTWCCVGTWVRVP